MGPIAVALDFKEACKHLENDNVKRERKESPPPIEERAAETLCDKLTATPISHLHMALEVRR